MMVEFSRAGPLIAARLALVPVLLEVASFAHDPGEPHRNRALRAARMGDWSCFGRAGKRIGHSHHH